MRVYCNVFHVYLSCKCKKYYSSFKLHFFVREDQIKYINLWIKSKIYYPHVIALLVLTTTDIFSRKQKSVIFFRQRQIFPEKHS